MAGYRQHVAGGILIGPVQICWVLLLALCAFLSTLGLLLRYAGLRLPAKPASAGGGPAVESTHGCP